MVNHYGVDALFATSRDYHDGCVHVDGVGVPDLVIGERSRRAEHDAFLHFVYLLLSWLGEPNAVQERGVVWIGDTELLIVYDVPRSLH